MNKYLSYVFNVGGETYVGMATFITFFCVFMDSLWDKWITPPWWTDVPAGVYSLILAAFVFRKVHSYWTDSKYNSPIGQPPGS